MSKIFFVAKCRPSAYLNRVLKHSGDVSESSKTKVMAIRTILNKKVIFYENGLRVIENNTELTDEEQFNSEILRLAHASILINEPVGDKRGCYVDATINPVRIVIYNTPIEVFLARAKMLIQSGRIDRSIILDQKVSELKHERDVRLFGRSTNSTHLPNG